MSAPFGPGFVSNHLSNAQDLASLLERHIAQTSSWSSVQTDLVTGLGDGHPRNAEQARYLVSAAAGYLAAAGGLPGVCVTCAIEALSDSGLVRGADADAVFVALETAAVLAVGVLRDPAEVPGIPSSRWVRAAYAAARISYTWMVTERDSQAA